MRKVQIITDSCSDLTGELMDRYGIDYAQMNTVRDGVTSAADLRWSRAEIQAFYNALRAGERITTTQVCRISGGQPVSRYLLIAE